jgi:Arc/MetJ-type ribon-helix-helix transcriptional regulator
VKTTQIITINLPTSHVEALETLTCELGVYPSRSEAIRQALREFIPRELEIAEKLNEMNKIEVERPLF